MTYPFALEPMFVALSCQANSKWPLGRFLPLFFASVFNCYGWLRCADACKLVSTMLRLPTLATVASGIILLIGGLLFSQPQRMFTATLDHPAIQYLKSPTTDAVTKLNKKIQEGELQLSSRGTGGYLESVLAALGISIHSQVLVLSQTSFQSDLISKTSPRALYFNDTVAVGWVPGGKVLEVAAQDPEQGVIFYTLSQDAGEKPQFERETECLQCHMTSFTNGVPGFVVMSMLPLSDDPNEYAQGWGVDHRTPFRDRWGGWYVTGKDVPRLHLGNVPVNHVEHSYTRLPAAPPLESVKGEVSKGTYLTEDSDIVALLVLNHQVAMTNLLTRLGWETRVAAQSAVPGQQGRIPDRVREVAAELVDYLLFIGEEPLPSPVQGSSGFAREFSAKGPRDTKGRSLRDLDLKRWLFRYPCSYLIYTEAFDALPGLAKTAIYDRMWEILSGAEKKENYSRLSLADRRAVVEILRATKEDLPEYFQPGRVQ